MSTAGKVLSVLALLLSVVWVLLAASVTELNRNGTKAVETLQAKVAQIQTSLEDAQRGLRELKDRTYQEQYAADNELTALEARQAELEKSRAQVLEILTRVKFQLEGVSATGKQALVSRDQRAAEKEAETKAKADAEAEVERLKAANVAMRGQLASLQTKFKAAREANKAMIDRLLKAKPADAPAPTPVTRPASFAR